jgi:hypothetical protein
MSNPTPSDSAHRSSPPADGFQATADVPPVSPPASAPPLERRLVLGLLAATLLLASLPYAFAYAITPPGARFVGTAYNIDDYCNYLSWVRQTRDGRFFFHNQFTTQPQRNLEFNLLFWVLGRGAAGLHLSPQAALQIARIGGGAILLWLVSKFYRAALPQNVPARVTAFAFACLSGGWGWLVWSRWHDKNLPGSPIDAWQPEAFTFLTLYTSPLMTVSTAFIVGALYCLLRGEQTGRWRYAVWAGLCGAVLGNIHSYDVLHLAAAWGLYLVVWTAAQRGRNVAASWGRGLLALALTLPTTMYEYLVLQREAVFRARAEVATLSPAFWHYALGYGVVFLLAIVALPQLARSVQAQKTSFASVQTMLVVLCWAVGGLAVIYLPLAFQRKMIMGTHIPLCLLAGVGAVWLTSKLNPRVQNFALAALVLLALPSSLLFLSRDMTHLTENRSETQQAPFLPDALVDCYGWLRAHTPVDSAVVGFPTLCAALPGFAGRTVWAGHWAETPHYGTKVAEFARFADAQAPDSERRVFLAQTHAQFLFYPNDVSGMAYADKNGVVHHFADLAHAPVSGTVPVYANAQFTIFRLPPP